MPNTEERRALKLLRENVLLGINSRQAEVFEQCWKEFIKVDHNGFACNIADTFMIKYGNKIWDETLETPL